MGEREGEPQELVESKAQSRQAPAIVEPPKSSFGARFVVFLVTAATIVGGVAAAIQIYESATKPKATAPTSLTKKDDRTQIGERFSAVLPAEWEVVDNASIEAGIGRFLDENALFGAKDRSDVSYVSAKLGSPDDAAGLLAQFALPKENPFESLDQLERESQSVIDGPQSGFVDSEKRSRLEKIERVRGADGEALRMIFSVAGGSDPAQITLFMNVFVGMSNGRVWIAAFFCRAGFEMSMSSKIISVAESIRIQP